MQFYLCLRIRARGSDKSELINCAKKNCMFNFMAVGARQLSFLRNYRIVRNRIWLMANLCMKICILPSHWLPNSTQFETSGACRRSTIITGKTLNTHWYCPKPYIIVKMFLVYRFIGSDVTDESVIGLPQWTKHGEADYYLRHLLLF